MDKYKEYISNLKAAEFKIDFDQKYSAIIHPRPVFAPPLAMLVGAAAVFIVAVGLYFNLNRSNDVSLMNYLLSEEKVDGSQVISYVFQ